MKPNDKTAGILINEFRENLISVIKESALHPSITALILTQIASECQLTAEQFVAHEYQQYSHTEAEGND